MGGLLILLVFSMVLGVAIGPVTISPETVADIVLHRLFGWSAAGDWSTSRELIVMQIRLPRVLIGAVVGAGLAVSGVAFQALVRNALAEPYLLGISSGASLGAASVILLGAFSAFGIWALSGGAFLGALAAVLTVYAIAQRRGQITPLRLILSGVAMGGVFSAGTSFLIMTAENAEASREVVGWMLGSLVGSRWDLVWLPLAVVLAGVVFLYAHARALNAISVGEDTAMTLGVDVPRFRIQVIVVASLVTGVVVAVSGAIGFVGLMLPHIVRILLGADHRRVVPAAALLGASFLIWVDIGARMLMAPVEVPIGIITALLGAPFFIILMRSRAVNGGL